MEVPIQSLPVSPPTDDDDVFAPGVDIAAFLELGVEERFGVQLKCESV
jgi:hypothetical protein